MTQHHDSSSTVWYFGYGSNNKLSSMHKRQITPLKTRAVFVPTHILTFDALGIPYSDPSFASIAAVSDDEGQDKASDTRDIQPFDGSIPAVHGVAYLLTIKDYHRLVLTEGSGVGYDEIKVEAFPITSETPTRGFMALAMKAKRPSRPNRAPSLRYMSLLIEGAKENGLPEFYIEYLMSLPTYSGGESQREILGAILFLSSLGRAIQTLAYTTMIAANEKGHSPQALGMCLVWFHWFIWVWHDRVHAKLWGPGDGEIIQYRGLQLR